MKTTKLSEEHETLLTPPPSPLQRMTRGFIALRHRNFRLFFWGQLISLIGTWMQTLGQQWLVYVLTGSALNLGIVSAFQYLPVLLFSLHGGVVVDRVPKRTLIICTQTASLLLALVLGVLTQTHVVQLWHVYLLAFLLGTVNAFDMPARQAFVVEMVGREDLMNAIALNASIFNGSRVVGPAIGAFVITAVGIAGCFFLNALSFVAVIVGLFMMRLPPRSAERPAQSRTLGQIGEGLRYIVSDRRVFRVLLLVSFISVFAIPAYTTLMPVVADQVLHVGVTGLGTLTSFLALGSVTAAVGLAYTSTPEQRRFFMIGGAATGSTLLLLFSFSRNFALSLALLVGVGFCMVANNATGNTIIQSYVPDRLRGRLMSVWSLVLVGLAPFGSFFTGSLANWTNAPFAIGVGALICLVAALVIVPQMLGWHWPRRKAPPQTSDIHLIEHEGVQHGD